MGKGTTLSKKKKAPSIHSRSARRATSPSIDTDKSLKNVRPPPESVDHRPSVLSIHHSAGVTKKQKKGRALSSKARKRQEKAQDRAFAVMERTEKKVSISKNQSRMIQSRAKMWEEVNQQIPSTKSGIKVTMDQDEESSDESGLDAGMGGVEERTSHADGAVKVPVESASESAMLEDDFDGIL
ncbi:Alb1-domain-containing protein [Xylariaceae sp. FL0594]|nr:Alb1-domain-containing protein [Xylariaceae sp. FL0594]